jgi:Domain of unknown function (DUF4260)
MIGTMGSVAGAGAVAGGAAGGGAGGVVARPRLVGRLAARARVSVVSAPPGSGKTVLLRSWISQPGVAGRAAPLPAVMLGAGYWQADRLVMALALVWLAHIGLDRLFGMGLKYNDGFTHTHLGDRRDAR